MTSFPTIQGACDDEKWQVLLSTMSVPGWPCVYVLGSFARYVTIYSQQVRALNLVDALCNGGLSRLHGIGVVGGGFAGATTAAALAVSGVSTTMFEKEADLLALQRNCQKRKVHPHIYDWPDIPQERRGTEQFDHAGLPLLDWYAEEAMKVV